MNYQFIESDSQLQTVCEQLAKESIIGVDLEADSMHSFKEKICLIQIAAGDRAFLVDPFTIKDFSCFRAILEDPAVTKVFHGADFDVRSLDREMNARIESLFDTEIACRFLNIRERGLGALLMDHFDVFVDKKFQKVDWSKRPLKEDMIAYSVGDVAHLVDLHDNLTGSLAEINRLHWAQEEFEVQAEVKYENNHRRPLFKKFKGAGKLDNRSLAVLENLLELRLALAEKKDQPLFKIMSNQSLLALTQLRPKKISDMVAKKALSKRQAQMYGEACLDAVAAAMALPHRALPSYPRTRVPRKTPAVLDRIKQLKKMREKMSEDIGMEPGFLINNTTISALAFANPACPDDLDALPGIRNWQKEAIGEDILQTLAHCR